MSLKFESQKEEAIYKALGMLGNALGFDNSESATEKLFHVLAWTFNNSNFNAMNKVLKQSHKDGLCYDMRGLIAERLILIQEDSFGDECGAVNEI